MLRAFGYPVATCSDKLGVVGSNFKMVKFFMLHSPGSCSNVASGHDHYFDFQLATSRNRVVKCTQHVAPNNVAI